MRTLLIVLIVGFVIGVSGFGVLGNEVALDVQKLGVFPSITSFEAGFDCFSDDVLFVYQDTDPSSPNYNPHAKMICESQFP